VPTQGASHWGYPLGESNAKAFAFGSELFTGSRERVSERLHASQLRNYTLVHASQVQDPIEWASEDLIRQKTQSNGQKTMTWHPIEWECKTQSNGHQKTLSGKRPNRMGKRP
jgi:hypothetical protein